MPQRITPRTTRRRSATLLALVLAGTVVACSPGGDAGPTASPDADTGSSPTPSPTVTPSDDAAATPVTPTDVPVDVMLPPEAFEAPTEPITESTTVEPWRVPDACGDPTPPAGATGMRTHAHGDGAYETVVGVQQVAAFAVADDAVAAAAALVEALGTCTDTTGSGTTYGLEPVAVGAQGHGLATWYYGAQGGAGDTGMGTYLVVTRRGSAVTLVSGEGGERTVGNARATTVAQAQQAWDRLCSFEVAGC